MDFSKLSSEEKRVVIAAAVVAILAVYSLIYAWGGLMVLPLLGAVGALAVVLMPQMSPGTSLPGSRGTLLLITGGGAALFWALNTLPWLGYIFRSLDRVDTYIYLIGLAAALWLGWQVWQAFQAEGGKFVIGTSSKADAAASAGGAAASDTAPAESSATAAPAAPAEPAATSAPAETMTTPAAEHVEEGGEDQDEERRV